MVTLEDALFFLEVRLGTQQLTDVQELVFCQCWQGKTYPDIAAQSGYAPDHIKFVGFKLWGLLSDIMDEKITKSNVHAVFRRQIQKHQSIEASQTGVLTLSGPTTPPRNALTVLSSPQTSKVLCRQAAERQSIAAC
jgi:hypothetical protein